MDPITMALLFAAGNFASQQITNQQNVEQNERNNQMQIFLQDRQNQFNREMWDMNNKYNSPQAQMDRLRKAGLNPGLAYGGNVANVSQGAVQQQQTVKTNPSYKQAPQFDSQTANVLLQQKQLDQQERVNQSIIEDNKASARLKNSEALQNETKQPFITLNEQAQLDLIQSRIAEANSNTDLNKIETNLRQLNYDFNQQTFDLRINQLKADYNLTIQQAKLAVSTALYYQQLKYESAANTQRTSWDIERVKKDIELANKRLGLTDAEIKEAENRAKQLELTNTYIDARTKFLTTDDGNLNFWGGVSEILNPNTSILAPVPTNNKKTTTVKHEYPKKTYPKKMK